MSRQHSPCTDEYAPWFIPRADDVDAIAGWPRDFQICPFQFYTSGIWMDITFEIKYINFTRAWTAGISEGSFTSISVREHQYEKFRRYKILSFYLCMDCWHSRNSPRIVHMRKTMCMDSCTRTSTPHIYGLYIVYLEMRLLCWVDINQLQQKKYFISIFLLWRHIWKCIFS